MKKQGITALVEAVARKDMATVEKCLAKGIDVNTRDRFGWSPLNEAITLGAVPFAQRLIKAGINLNKVGPDGISFLECALRAEQREIIKLLLNAGAFTNPPANRFADALHTACALGDAELVQLLISKGSDPKRVPDALLTAAGKKSPEVAKLLLAAGADVNYSDSFGTTALISASISMPPLSMFYRVKKVKALAEKGITFNPRPKPRQVEDLVRLLIEYGADVNHKDKNGRIPLTYTRFSGVARVLIDARTRLDTRDNDGHDVKYWLRKNRVRNTRRRK